jgi:hypothetical protein
MSELKTNKISTNDQNNVAIDNALGLKSYDTTARDALTSVTGDMIYNTTDSKVQTYNGSSWDSLGNPFVDVDFLVIAGGGCGAYNQNGDNYGSGGGGAGGYRTSYGSGSISGGSSTVETDYRITADGSTTYTVTIGAGSGTERIPASNSKFAEIISIGGGSSENYNSLNGQTGGSGSGVTGFPSSELGYGLEGQGSNGGSSNGPGGGGGGASVVGANAVSLNGGAGGAGQSSSITGSAVTRGGGGGGAGSVNGSGGSGGTGGGGAGANGANGGAGLTGTNGTVNTGGGGGGGSGGTSIASSSNGGSGLVVLRWATADATIGATRTGLTDGGVQTDGSDSYIVFTAGTGTISFS